MAKILVVDDSELARNLIADVLKKAGHDTKSVSGGNDALAVLEGGGFDLLISDWVMPGMMGEELLAKVRAAYADLPVIVVTSYYDSELLPKDKSPGDGVLSKPFKNEDLLDTVHRFVSPP